MDADSFDALARALVSRHTRRRLSVAAGALLGELLVRPPFGAIDDALAKNKKGKGKKKKKKKASCDTAGCPPCQECVNGECEWIPFPDCYGCQEPLCEGGVFNCKETGVGIPCGEHCLGAYECCTNQVPGCPEGKTCCAAESTDGQQGRCIDPKTQCCGAGFVGQACEGDCCNPNRPQEQICCTAHPILPRDKYCIPTLPPCSYCEIPCPFFYPGTGQQLCCNSNAECCQNPETDAYYCADSCNV